METVESTIPEELQVKTVMMLMGLPRSGKSTLARKMHLDLGYPVICPDDVRLAMHGKAFILRAEDMVWSVTRYMARILLLGPCKGIVIDACNNTRKRRDEWVTALKPVDTNLVFRIAEVVTEKEMCLARAGDDQRLRETIERMAALREPPQEDEVVTVRFNV